MFRNVKELRGYAIRATDGLIGKVDDFYFDDEDWGIRYLVADIDSWLSDRKVLISPTAIDDVLWMDKEVSVALGKSQVQRSPGIDTRKPVSRQHEVEYFASYRYPPYWGGAGLWGMSAYPGTLTTEGRIEEDLRAHRTHTGATPENRHLRNTNALLGYHIQATDGDIGHLEDLLVDDKTWVIRYLIVNTSNWWGGKRVLILPRWIDTVSWADASISVALTRHAISHAPLYESADSVEDRADETMPQTREMADRRHA
jgi:sporulation protein YlmC with PRC-barrel domain